MVSDRVAGLLTGDVRRSPFRLRAELRRTGTPALPQGEGERCHAWGEIDASVAGAGMVEIGTYGF